MDSHSDLSVWQLHDKKGTLHTPPSPRAPLADTHGHLTHFRKTTAVNALVRAALVGVRLLVVPVDPVDEVGPGLRYESPHAFFDWLETQLEQAADTLDMLAQEGICVPEFPDWPHLAELTRNVRIVAGVHPYGALELDSAAQARLHELLDNPLCVGVGEFGIDVGPYAKLSVEEQEQAFRLQLRIAHERHMPVELHLRDEEDGIHTSAHDVALRLLQEEGLPAAGCDLHCYTSNAELMRPFVDLGCHIAFGGAMTFRRSDDIRGAALACPSRLMLSETDSPYMAPEPLRGCECEPAMVSFTVARLAEMRSKQGVEELSTYQQLWSNACGLFGV